MVRTKPRTSIGLFCYVFVCIVWAFLLTAYAEDPTPDAWVWNSESYRVMLYETPDLSTSSIYYHPYLLNGFPVQIQETSDSGESVCISFLEHTFWIDSKHISMLPPEDTGSHVYRSVTEDISLSLQNEEIIPLGTRVEVRGYIYDTVIVKYNGEILEIHPTSIQLREITYEAPDYLLSQAEVIPICKEKLIEVYGLTASDIESMRIEFVSYSTLSSPSLYIIRFCTDTGASYTIHCDGEFGVIIRTHYAPYGVG